MIFSVQKAFRRPLKFLLVSGVRKFKLRIIESTKHLAMRWMCGKECGRQNLNTAMNTLLPNSKKQGTATKTRTEFPETWLWQIVKIK